MINLHKKQCRYKKCSCKKYYFFEPIEQIEIKSAKESEQMLNVISEIIASELFRPILFQTYKSHKEF